MATKSRIQKKRATSLRVVKKIAKVVKRDVKLDAISHGPSMTIHEVAAMFQWSLCTTYRAARAGRLPGTKLGGGIWRFSRERMQSLLNGGT